MSFGRMTIGWQRGSSLLARTRQGQGQADGRQQRRHPSPDQAGGELGTPQWATAICFYTRIDATSTRLSVSVL